MEELRILERLERAKGANIKKKVLSEAVDNTALKDLLLAALSFGRKFHIKKFELPSASDKSMNDSHKKFMDLLLILEKRTITGHAAQAAVEGFLSQCDAMQQKWYSRVLKKDLRSGISVKTVNSVGFNIPVFDVMLATDGTKSSKLETLIKKGAFVSPKMDGYRCLAICDGTSVTLYSRNGSMFDNFPTIVESLEKVTAGSPMILDGEIMSSDFQAMQQSAFASVRGTTVGDVKYHIFGFIPLEEWESEQFEIPMSERKEFLDAWFDSQEMPENLVKVEQVCITSMEEIEALESKYLKDGYEGAMVLPDMPYYKGRKANALMKFKRMHTMDCEVIGMYEGTGKHEGRLGGLSVMQDSGETCDVGSGFTDADREWIWAHKDEVIGRIAEVQYQELTNDNIMRFPVFLRWRDTGVNTGKI